MIRGIKTSEFGVILAAGIATALSKRLGIPITADWVLGILAAAYAIGRSGVKLAEAKNPAIAADAEKVRADLSTALTRLESLQATIAASPALSAEERAVIAKVSTIAPVAGVLSAFATGLQQQPTSIVAVPEAQAKAIVAAQAPPPAAPASV